MIRAWLAFAIVALLVVVGTGLLTRHVLATERDRLKNEALGQALWRLDTDAAALLVAEAGRGVDERGADGARTRIEVGHDGLLVAASGQPPQPGLAAAVAALGPALPAPGAVYADPGAMFLTLPPASLDVQGSFGNRSGKTKQLLNTALNGQNMTQESVRIGAVAARWHGGDLLLLRRLRRTAGERIQAALVDLPAVQGRLLAGIGDLLPGARLEPSPDDAPALDRMAVLPFRLVAPDVAQPLSVPTRNMLLMAWAAVLAGLGGTATALILTRRLAERRASFVSAVTHELRTPLTAMRLHADLLADARVGGDAVRRAEAVAVLQGEAKRLARLIDNVLDYARLERRQPPRPRVMPLAEAIAPLLPRFSARLAEVGLELVAGPMPATGVRCDPEALGRILANLVDNAAKYAAPAGDRRIELTLVCARHRVVIALRDHGPGLAADLRSRVFAPFSRSAEAAAGSAPGVGLGLALCRRLARAQGGELRLESPEDGGLRAVLELPVGQLPQ